MASSRGLSKCAGRGSASPVPTQEPWPEHPFSYCPQTYEQHEWVIHLAGKLLANDAEALSLLALNPFADRAPPR